MTTSQMVPNQECRHVPAKKGADFLTQLYPEMGGQVRVDRGF